VSVPGGFGNGDSVGFVYVRVIADTSGMREQINSAGRSAGKEGGGDAGAEWTKEFNSRIQKDINIGLSERALDAQVKRLADNFSKKFAKQMAKGDQVTFKVTRAQSRELAKIAAMYERPLNEVLKKFEKQMSRTTLNVVKDMDRMAERVERDFDKAIRLNVDYDDAAVREAQKRRKEIDDLRMAMVQQVKREEKEITREYERRGELILRGNREQERIQRRQAVVYFKQLKKQQQSLRGGGFDPFEGMANSLSRAGTGGFFDTVTNLMGAVPRLFSNITRGLRTAAPFITKFGQGIVQATANMGKFGRVTGSVLGRFTMGLGQLASKAGIILLPVMLGAMGKAITLLSPLVNALIGTLVSLGSALGNTVAAGIVLGPVLLSLVGGFAAATFAAKEATSVLGKQFAASLSGSKKDLAEYNKALKNLGPNAQAAVRAFEPLTKGLKALREQAEQEFFKDMAGNIRSFAPAVDVVRRGMVSLAGAMGNVVDKFFALGQNQTFVASLETLRAAATPIIESIGGALVNVFAGITNLFALAAPLAQRFAQSISDIATRFLEWTTTEETRASILTFLNNAYTIGSQVVNIIGTIGQIIMSVFTSSQVPLMENGSLLQAINDKLDAWLAWLQDPANGGTIKQWFRDAAAVARTVWQAIEDIIRKFQEWNTPQNRADLQKMVDMFADIAGFIMDAIGFLSTFYDMLRNPPQFMITRVLQNLPGWAKSLLGIPGGTGGAVLINGQPTRLPSGYNYDLPSSYSPGAPLRRGVGTPRSRDRRAAGGLITRPELSWIGEAGPELVIPLVRPLPLVDPAVRDITAAIRSGYGGMEKSKAAPQKVLNLTQNITTPSTDPRAAAAEVLNRAIVLARM